ncbi:MAG: hypothetical protein KDD82_08895 [Planctomycetes bacterium]|nr:hypothetical protein [Planctomycetota bacterium]
MPELLAESTGKILRALTRVLLRNGVACGTAEQWIRKAYVDEAFKLATEAGAKPTVSSVSAQTGLSRKEVKRLSGPQTTPGGRSEKYNRAVRVLNGWLNDRAYSSEEGVALPLSLQPDAEPSFAQLVKDYSGDVTPKAMLDLLTASSCVSTTQDMVHLVRHAYVPANDSREILRILGSDSEELIRTIDHNLTCDAQERRLQRKVSTSLLPRRLARSFKELVRRRSQSLLEEFVSWLNDNEATSDEEALYVSVGIYLYEHDVPQEPDR